MFGWMITYVIMESASRHILKKFEVANLLLHKIIEIGAFSEQATNFIKQLSDIEKEYAISVCSLLPGIVGESIRNYNSDQFSEM